MSNIDVEVYKYDKIHYYKNVISNPSKLIDVIESTDSYLDEHTSITKWKKWSASNDEYVFGEQKWVLGNMDNETDNLLLFINKEIKKFYINWTHFFQISHFHRALYERLVY